MGDRSAIEWTDATWNPVTGCSHVSEGCRHCYAETLSLRMGWSTKPWTAPNAAANVVLHPERLEQPLRWTKPRRVFVNSMSDLFHERVPATYIDRVFAVMALAKQHMFQVLTKRPSLMQTYLTTRERQGPDGPTTSRHLVALEALDLTLNRWRDSAVGRGVIIGDDGLVAWPLANVWLGVSCEDQRTADERIPLLLQTPASVGFISAEPLLGPIDLSHVGSFRWGALNWVIVGGESGAGARPMDPAWARSLRDQCVRAGVPFFFKQIGGRTPKSGGRLLDGREWNEFPRVRHAAR